MTEPIYSDIDQLSLNTRIYNTLRRGGFHTCAQLLHAGRAEVRKLRGIGPGAENEIAVALAVIQTGEWTEHGTPLPALSCDAAQMVEALGLGDSLTIRQGLARVIRATPFLDRPEHLAAVAELERAS